MEFSSGALGMLAKKYRAILKKCLYLNMLLSVFIYPTFVFDDAALAADKQISTETEWTTQLQQGISLPYSDNGQLNVSENVTLNLNSGDFISGAAQSNKISMGDYGRISSKGTVRISGDVINLGSQKFAANNPSGIEATIKAESIELLPSGNIFTMNTGKLYVSGDNAGSHLSIGSGSGTLLIDGGSLRLGNSDPGLAGGTVNGNIIVGNASQTLINSEMKVASSNWTVTGNVTIENSGQLQVNGDKNDLGQYWDSSLTINGSLINNGGTIIQGEEQGEFNDGAIYHTAGNINVKGGAVGNENSRINVFGSELTIANINWNGGQINFDPPFAADGDLSNASLGALSFASDNIDARINIGQNSIVTLGSTDTSWLKEQINKYQADGKGTWSLNGISSALGIRKPQTLAVNGGINVDGTWINGGNAAEVNKARFAANSLLVVDAAGIGNNPALSGNGTGSLEVNSNAKLLITDAQAGSDVIVTNNFAASSIAEDGWSQNLSTDTPLLGAAGEEIAAGNYVVHVKSNGSAADIFPQLSSELASVVNSAVAAGKLNPNSSQPGTRFISRAVNNDYLGDNDRVLAAATIESAARMAIVGAVPQMTLAANDSAGAAITQRTSMVQPDSGIQSIDAEGNIINAQEVHKKNFALWIMPLFQSSNGFGMEAGNFDYDFSGTLGGVAIGADYTFENAIRTGITFNIGGGYAQGTGELNKTTNDMSFWGIGAYAGWAKNNFGLAADINFTSSYNRLKQELPSSMHMDDLKSDVTAWAISTGLRAEYKFETAILDIIPHLGFRYISLNTDSYDINSGGTVVNGDSFTQNIWTFPVGVSFTKNFDMENGWHFKPLVDLNVTPATGDIKAKTTVRFTGIGQDAEIDTKTMDYITYGGTAGIEFGNDNLSFGVSYHGQFGAESSAHGVLGTFRYEF